MTILQNIILRGIQIGLAPAAAPQDVGLRVTSGTMTYWSTYESLYPGLIAVGGTFDPSTLGSNGILSNSDLTVTFSGASSVLGLDTNGPYWSSIIAWEYEVNTDYDIQIGYFAGGTYDPDASTQANSHVYHRDGTISGPGTGTGSGWPYTTGDIIGVVYDPTTFYVDFYKNGEYQGHTTIQSDTGSVIASCVSTTPPPPPDPSEWWGINVQTGPYDTYLDGGFPDFYFYRKLVTRDGSGNVTSATVNTSSAMPVVRWQPNDSDPMPIITQINSGAGQWEMDISNQSQSFPSGGGVLQIAGAGTSILNLVINWDSNNYWIRSYIQTGSPT